MDREPVINLQPLKNLQRSACLALALILANSAFAESRIAQEFFDSANAAFRQGDFAAALAKYNDTLAYGKDTPRVFYNMGLAHYRLGQYEQAKWAFVESSTDEKLAALSFYQLGALARREGNIDEAIGLLTRARDTAESEKLRRQSIKALAIVGAVRPEFESAVSVGYGYDDNAFLSPDSPYIDYSRAMPTLVDPVPVSGAYVPIRVKGYYWRPLSTRTALKTSYSFRGEYHTDTELQNADFHDHRVSIGGERKVGNSGSKNRRLALEAFYRARGETNFDHDDGLERFDDGQSIADRYDYHSVGAETNLRNYIHSSRFEIIGGSEQRDYDDVPTASSLDMTNFWVGGGIRLPLSANSRLKFGYEFYVRDFDQRRSRDISGDASLSNPTLKYQYHGVEASFKHRFSKGFVAELEYFYTLRNDQFVGYNDYQKNIIRLATTFEITKRIHTRIRVDYRNLDYPNAFAFDNPTQAHKEYQKLDASLIVNYQFTDQLSIRADIRNEVVESSDPRGEYNRLRGAISMYWEYE